MSAHIRFWSSTAAKLALYAEALVSLLYSRIVVRWSARRVVSEAVSERRDGSAALSAAAVAAAGPLLRLANLPLARTTCLPRSVALRGMLARRGIASELCIGVLVRDRALFGHAWVEVNGVVVGDDASVQRHFARLSREATLQLDTSDGFHWRAPYMIAAQNSKYSHPGAVTPQEG